MKQTVALMGISVVVGLVISYNWVYIPKQNEAQSLQVQAQEETARQQAAGEAAALFLQLERYRKRLPDELDTSWLAKHIVETAQRLGLQLASITQEAPHQFEGYTQLSVNLQFHTSYHQLGRFIDEIERSDYFLRVDQLRIVQPEDGGPAQMQATFSTLFFPTVAKGR
ncbi:MAG: type 4a pilus biogenesis protein PilO [Nitrososphaera sp.]|nr:type 4a pilus biogenesis protein PilO [Nitrososphaera sp.]